MCILASMQNLAKSTIQIQRALRNPDGSPITDIEGNQTYGTTKTYKAWIEDLPRLVRSATDTTILANTTILLYDVRANVDVLDRVIRDGKNYEILAKESSPCDVRSHTHIGLMI